jgi:hypothetical protein
MKMAVIIVPIDAATWYPHMIIVPTMSTKVMKKEAIKGIRTIPYTPIQTRQDMAAE